MYFKNDKAEIEILIGGYTDTPEYYEESVGKNALSCQMSYYGEDLGDGVLWDELFQTDDIVRLYDMALCLATGKADSFVYADQWDMVMIRAKQNADSFEMEVSVMQRAQGKYLSAVFPYTKQELMDFVDELGEYKKAYPVRI